MFFKSKNEKPSPDTGSDAAAPAAPESSSDLKRDAAQQRAVSSKSRFTALGEVVSVLMAAPPFRGMRLSEVEQLVVPALRTGQVRVGQVQTDQNGIPTPAAVAIWASVSEEVDQRLSQSQNFALKSNEWKSGSIPWLIAAAGDRRVLGPMLDHIQDTILQGKKLKMRTKDSASKVTAGSPPKQVVNGLPQQA
jgi:hemolysin-activating ACP:hemolysin acyltransferase